MNQQQAEQFEREHPFMAEQMRARRVFPVANSEAEQFMRFVESQQS